MNFPQDLILEHGFMDTIYPLLVVDDMIHYSMLGCYIICSEILVEVNQLTVRVKVDRKHRQQVKIEVDR
jgi:hypothetical protein